MLYKNRVTSCNLSQVTRYHAENQSFNTGFQAL